MFIPLMWIVHPTCKRAASCDAFMLGFTMSNNIRPMWAGSSNMLVPTNIMTHTMWIVKQNVLCSNHDNVMLRGIEIYVDCAFPWRYAQWYTSAPAAAETPVWVWL